VPLTPPIVLSSWFLPIHHLQPSGRNQNTFLTIVDQLYLSGMQITLQGPGCRPNAPWRLLFHQPQSVQSQVLDLNCSARIWRHISDILASSRLSSGRDHQQVNHFGRLFLPSHPLLLPYLSIGLSSFLYSVLEKGTGPVAHVTLASSALSMKSCWFPTPAR